jgi:hypothetical protein
MESNAAASTIVASNIPNQEIIEITRRRNGCTLGILLLAKGRVKV